MLKNRTRFIRVYKGRRRKTISEEAGKNEKRLKKRMGEIAKKS